MIYFVLCEVLDLFYELGLTRQISGTIGMTSAFLLIIISFPGMPVGEWAHNQIATLLGIPATDAIAYNSFWPRFLGVQFTIIFCTLAFVLVIYSVSRLFKLRIKAEKSAKHSS